ncbi:MAG: arginase family protein [Candidatus Acidiferrales bacterium]
MAVKITRQPKKIALLGSATSAAALRPGHERAPAALRDAGLVARLEAAGFEVADLGGTATYVSQQDDEHPRARNVSAILKSLDDLRPRVEVAVKSGALPLILSGDCISVLSVIAGARRYHRNVSLVYFDRDADLKFPATTSTGCIDEMVISQVIGRGAPELVRFWGEPPLVREPDVALFGFERVGPQEEQFLASSPLRRHAAIEVSAVGPAVAAHAALERAHAANHEFVLHFDVDVIAGEEFPWTNSPGAGGLSFDEVRESLRVFAGQPNLAAFEVAGYNPELDPDGQGARKLVDLLGNILASRIESAAIPAEASQPAAARSDTSQAPPAPEASISSAAETADPAPEVGDSMPGPADPEPFSS